MFQCHPSRRQTSPMPVQNCRVAVRSCRSFSKGGAMGMNFGDPLNDVVDLTAINQQHILRHAHVRSAHFAISLQLLEAIAISLKPLFPEQTLEAPRVNCFIHNSIQVLLMITVTARNAFGVESLDKLIT